MFDSIRTVQLSWWHAVGHWTPDAPAHFSHVPFRIWSIFAFKIDSTSHLISVLLNPILWLLWQIQQILSVFFFCLVFRGFWCFVNLVSIRPKGNCGLFEIKINKSIEDIATCELVWTALMPQWRRNEIGNVTRVALKKVDSNRDSLACRRHVMLVKTLIYNTLSHFPHFLSSPSNFATQKFSNDVFSSSSTCAFLCGRLSHVVWTHRDS